MRQGAVSKEAIIDAGVDDFMHWMGTRRRKIRALRTSRAARAMKSSARYAGSSRVTRPSARSSI